MPLSGKFRQTTPLAEQEWTLELPMMADRWVEFRSMLRTHADFSDFYALVDALMDEAQRDYTGQNITAIIPDAPVNLAVSEMSLLVWDETEYAIDYEVEHNGVVTVEDMPGYSFNGGHGETHSFRVRARSESGFGLWSDQFEVTFVPDVPVMDEPTRYSMDVTFTWGAVASATGYRVFGKFTSGVDETSPYVDVADPVYTRTLTSGQTLYVRVAAINVGGLGELSDEVSMEVPTT